MKKQKKFVRSYFTLTELMVVIVILVLLASIAAPMVFKHISNARIAAAQTQIKNLEAALDIYRTNVGRYPDSEEDGGLEALVSNTTENEKWQGPYLKPAAVPKDPWGNEYVYVCPGEHGEFDLYSYGADGVEGGEGENADITNWVESDSE